MKKALVVWREFMYNSETKQEDAKRFLKNANFFEVDDVFFPKQFTVGFTLKKKRGVHRLARACSVGRGLGVAWAWLGRAWLGRGVGVAWAYYYYYYYYYY